jgi:hypothetical protein
MVLVSISFFILGLLCGFILGMLHGDTRLFARQNFSSKPKLAKPTSEVVNPLRTSPVGCPVEGCRISRKHSHAEDFLKLIKKP